MIERLIEDVTEADFSRLVEAGATESRTLEFKRDLPGGKDDDKKEFLADVTSLANTNGGDLLYGIGEAEGGTAGEAVGLDRTRAEAEIGRLENILRDGVEPRLPGLRIRRVPLSSGRDVLMFRVPASLTAPHRVTFRNSGRFFARNSRGKYEMDTFELRHAFTSSEQIPARLRGMHEEAVSCAFSGLPFRIRDAPTGIVSLIPLRMLRELRQVDVTRETALAPLSPGYGFKALPTLEGMVLYSDLDPPDARDASGAAYTAAFARTSWNGRIDAAWNLGGTRCLRDEALKVVSPSKFEDGLTEICSSGVAKLQALGVEGPWVVMVTIVGIDNHLMLLGDGYPTTKAWRTTMSLPECVLEQIDRVSLTPIFRAFWLLFGEERPGNFGLKGGAQEAKG